MVDEIKSEEAEKPDPWWDELKKVAADADRKNAETRAEFQARVAALQLPPAQIVQYQQPSLWASPVRPWWAPDAQGMLAIAIVAMTTSALHIRMLHSSTIEDKLLDTMITILFSTCLVTVYQYTFGSSRGSSIKDDSQTRLVEKLMPPAVPAPTSATSTTTTETKT